MQCSPPLRVGRDQHAGIAASFLKQALGRRKISKDERGMERVPLPARVFRHFEAAGDAALFSTRGVSPQRVCLWNKRGGSREGNDDLDGQPHQKNAARLRRGVPSTEADTSSSDRRGRPKIVPA